ncbi:MAG: hypothetical protein Q9218_002636 [Villophora microphyllina]
MTDSPPAVDDQQELDSASITPTASQIETILEPWRTIDQREFAVTPNYLPAVWLRTCYTPGSDQKHEELVDKVDMTNAIDGDHRVLNDPDLYNFGAHWHRLFDYMPELLGPRESEAINEALEDLRAVAEGGVTRAPAMMLEDLSPLPAEHLEETVHTLLQSQVHKQCVVGWMVLEDEAAMESGEVAVMFLDAYGQVVRSQRSSPRDAEQMGGAWSSCMFDEMDEWELGELGEEYKLGGTYGRLLLESFARPSSGVNPG